MSAMKFVCPNPTPWNEIYQKLKAAWEAKGSIGTPPPAPLILNDRAFSSDFEKHAGWKATVRWAEENDLSHLISEP